MKRDREGGREVRDREREEGREVRDRERERERERAERFPQTHPVSPPPRVRPFHPNPNSN